MKFVYGGSRKKKKKSMYLVEVLAKLRSHYRLHGRQLRVLQQTLNPHEGG